jgi:hypothetical protein
LRREQSHTVCSHKVVIARLRYSSPLHQEATRGINSSIEETGREELCVSLRRRKASFLYRRYGLMRRMETRSIVVALGQSHCLLVNATAASSTLSPLFPLKQVASFWIDLDTEDKQQQSKKSPSPNGMHKLVGYWNKNEEFMIRTHYAMSSKTESLMIAEQFYWPRLR